MKIRDLRFEKSQSRAKVAATVIWEDCERPTQGVYFETDTAFADSLSCSPHAFLVGCIMPALHHGEKRIFVEGEVCPELRDGLITAMSWMRHWYDPKCELVQIEAKMRSNMPSPRTPARAGMLFSGGIDSLAELRVNRLNFPLEHPGSIKDGLLIYGQNIESDDRPETFAGAVRSLSQVVQDAGVKLIPVYTNVRSLDYDTGFFLFKFQAAILAAVAHAFARRFTVVTIASGVDTSNLYEWGTHPVLDLNYSSSDLRIRHGSIVLTRLEKTKLVADWEVALHNIKVCPPNWPGANCGQCEKCLRTMLALLALGMLDQSRAFPKVDITTELIWTGVYIDREKVHWYRELITPLKKIGRHDLAYVLEDKILKYNGEPNWRGKIRRFRRKYLAAT